MESKRFCTYVRVSTERQGRSGLGIESQREICNNYIASQQGDFVREFCDYESGTSRKRRGLIAAIDFCRVNNSTLVFAKLDRLARDVEFTFKVVNSGINVHFCDMPQLNTLVLGVMATVAQYERELISQRTKAALAESRKRGIKSGSGSEKYYMSEAKRKEVSLKASISRNANVIEHPEFAAFCRILRNSFSELASISSSDELFYTAWNTSIKLHVSKDKIASIIEAMKEANACNSELFQGVDFNSDKIYQTVRSKIQATFKSLKVYQRLNLNL